MVQRKLYNVRLKKAIWFCSVEFTQFILRSVLVTSSAAVPGSSCSFSAFSHSPCLRFPFFSFSLLLSHFLFFHSPPLPPQLLVEIIDASSVITWDFDVCKGDVVFHIYHSKRAPQTPRKDPLATHSITSPGGNNVQLIDRSWTLGQDYSMVESPLTCKEGESVQVGGGRGGVAVLDVQIMYEIRV